MVTLHCRQTAKIKEAAPAVDGPFPCHQESVRCDMQSSRPTQQEEETNGTLQQTEALPILPNRDSFSKASILLGTTLSYWKEPALLHHQGLYLFYIHHLCHLLPTLLSLCHLLLPLLSPNLLHPVTTLSEEGDNQTDLPHISNSTIISSSTRRTSLRGGSCVTMTICLCVSMIIEGLRSKRAIKRSSR